MYLRRSPTSDSGGCCEGLSRHAPACAQKRRRRAEARVAYARRTHAHAALRTPPAPGTAPRPPA
eukprot:4392831-Lingulodinium_polyedra.AAC.1